MQHVARLNIWNPDPSPFPVNVEDEGDLWKIVHHGRDWSSQPSISTSKTWDTLLVCFLDSFSYWRIAIKSAWKHLSDSFFQIQNAAWWNVPVSGDISIYPRLWQHEVFGTICRKRCSKMHSLVGGIRRRYTTGEGQHRPTKKYSSNRFYPGPGLCRNCYCDAYESIRHLHKYHYLVCYHVCVVISAQEARGDDLGHHGECL